MSKGFLITRPRYEDLTDLLYHWSKVVIKVAREKQYGVFDLSGVKANKKEFVSYAKKNKPALIFFNGHGSETVITGHDNEVLVQVGGWRRAVRRCRRLR